MKNEISAAIIGAGSIADYHINGYVKSGVKLVAIADANEKAAESKGKQNGIPNVFVNYSEMLEECPEVDAISVCTPNFLHTRIAVDCLRAGRNVFCEKPPALNARDTAMMQQEAEKSGKILMFDFNNRARPDVQALFEYVSKGEVGKINSAQALWIRRCGIPGFGGWFTQKALSGGGPVVDLLHMTDLALYFMGFPDPEWVLSETFYDFAQDRNFKGPWGIPDVEEGIVDVETSSHAFVTFKTQQVLFARNSWAEQNKREEVSMTFQGAKAGGMVKRLFRVDGMDDTALDTCEMFTIENGTPVNKKILAQPDPAMGRERAVMNFVNAVLGKEKPLNTPRQAVKLMKIIEAIYESARTRAPVKIV
jgi:predicted dehydrogenase